MIYRVKEEKVKKFMESQKLQQAKVHKDGDYWIIQVNDNCEEIIGYEKNICPKCGTRVDSDYMNNISWDGDELESYFVCSKCGCACCDSYDIIYSQTSAIED